MHQLLNSYGQFSISRLSHLCLFLGYGNRPRLREEIYINMKRTYKRNTERFLLDLIDHLQTEPSIFLLWGHSATRSFVLFSILLANSVLIINCVFISSVFFSLTRLSTLLQLCFRSSCLNKWSFLYARLVRNLQTPTKFKNVYLLIWGYRGTAVYINIYVNMWQTYYR